LALFYLFFILFLGFLLVIILLFLFVLAGSTLLATRAGGSTRVLAGAAAGLL
jgi:hypothetical protein